MAGTVIADIVQAASTSQLNIKNGVALTPPTIADVNNVQIGTFCRAWINFNGTGTPAARASFNVSSITDNGVGTYTVNFTNAMPDINFACVGACASLTARNGMTVQITRQNATTVANTTTTQRIWVVDDAGNNGDVDHVSVAFFR
jgi:hypothetical protein